MAKILGILLLVGAVWLGVEIATNGTEGAFGGIFAQGGDVAPSEPLTQKARSRVQESMKAAAARSTNGIDEGGEDEEADMIDPSEVDPDSLEH